MMLRRTTDISLPHTIVPMIRSAAVLLLAAAINVPAATMVSLTEDGAPRTVIVLPADPHENETLTADELREYITRISGAVLPVVTAGGDVSAGVAAIRLGGAADAALETAIREQGDSYSSFALFIDEKGADIRGLNPEGTLYGAYELLEQLGVRWFMPGEIGTVIPETASLKIAHQRTVQVPSMDWRQLQWLRHSVPGEYRRRLRLGGEHRSTGAHGLPGEAGVFRPFDFLATDAVRFGEPNTVSVKVTNDRLAELGTGGIVAPAMFWSPHDPDWQP